MQALGIDLGTANTVVCDADGNVILNEPSVMALRHDGARRPKVVAFGREARALIGRTPPEIRVCRPLQDGVIVDLETARRFLVEVLNRVPAGWWSRRRLSAVIGVPVGATALERRALLEAAEEAGITRPLLIPEPIAGALGCGVDPSSPEAHVVVDVGGGTSEVSAFSAWGPLASRSSPLAGDEMTLAVYRYLRDEHQLVVGEIDAEEIKIQAATKVDPAFTIEGQDAATGRARVVNLAVEEVLQAVRPVAEAIVETISACLEDLPAQGVRDVMAEGVLVVGGGSLLPNFDKLLHDAFGFTIRRAERPLTCVAEGAALALTRYQELLEIAA